MEETSAKPVKIFISHASKDKEYVKKLVELLDGMGLDQTQIFCSSLPGYDIPVGSDIFDYLRQQFQEYELHVFLIHSKKLLYERCLIKRDGCGLGSQKQLYIISSAELQI